MNTLIANISRDGGVPITPSQLEKVSLEVKA